MAELVVASAAVTRAEPQPAVGPELQLPAVVVARVRVPDRQEQPPGRRVGDVGIAAERWYSRTWISPVPAERAAVR